MKSLREEIANIFDECMGYHEGIRVPDHEEGYRAIDYSDKVLKLVVKRIDSINDLDDEIKEGNYHGDEEFWAGYQLGFDKAIELTKKEMLK